MIEDKKKDALKRAAEFQRMATEALTDSLSQIATISDLNWSEINRASNAAGLALRALRACYAIDLGRVILGDVATAPTEGAQKPPMTLEEMRGREEKRKEQERGHMALAASQANSDDESWCGAVLRRADDMVACHRSKKHDGEHTGTYNGQTSQWWQE